MNDVLRPGDIVYIGAACGVPYTVRGLLFRITRATRHRHADGGWLTGYELAENGQAIAHREIYVGILAGLQPAVMTPALAKVHATALPRTPRQHTHTTASTRSIR